MPGFVGNQSSVAYLVSTISQMEQQIQALQVQLNYHGAIVDTYGNTLEFAAVNVNQTLTIGATTAQPAGVQVTTGLTGAGRAEQQGLVTTTISTSHGSTMATVTNAAGLAIGMMIGAATVNGTSAIVPGTYISAISGTNVTLSQAAAESGSGLYCAACVWRLASVAAGLLLARAQYNPAIQTQYSLSNAPTAVDNAHLAVGFTVPASGSVIVTWQAVGGISQGATLPGYLMGSIWDVAAGAELSVSYETTLLWAPSGGTTVYLGMCKFRCFVTGLTPGAALNWAPAARYLNNAGYFYAGVPGTGNGGPFLIEVLAA